MAETTKIAIPAWARSEYGPPPDSPRDGDKQQARQRINVLVRSGRLTRPNSLPCADCGHVWKPGERRHEYDHHLGYGRFHHYDVEPVCSICHNRRAEERGETLSGRARMQRQAAARKEKRKRFCGKGHALSYGKNGIWRCYECRRMWFRNRRQNERARERIDGRKN